MLKKLVKVLTAAVLIITIIFAAACSRGYLDTEMTIESVFGESESASANTDETTGFSEAVSTLAANSGNATEKSVSDDNQTEQTYICETEPDEESLESNKENELNPDTLEGEWTLYINEIGDGWFKANHFGMPPRIYKVLYDLNGEFKVGDTVIARLSRDIPEGTVIEFGFFVVKGISVKKSDTPLNPNEWYKPIIYLYPEEKTEISVRLDYNGRLTCTIPEYRGGWDVTAYPNGRIINFDGVEYPYLFWEGECNADFDLSKGFCVKGGDTEKFLCDKLALMGMSKSEIKDFNDFWVPYLQKNPYNRVCFQTTAYTDNAELIITPKPDSVLRVFMVFTPLDEPIRMEEQSFVAFERKGFAVVEWGGAMTKMPS